jgi:hypothetical protein
MARFIELEIVKTFQTSLSVKKTIYTARQAESETP